MTVDQGQLVSAMTHHWQETLKNTHSPALQAVWAQMGEAFNRQIQNYGTEAGKRWQVLQPATGTGKTQGLAVYCSLLARAALGQDYDPHEALRKSSYIEVLGAHKSADPVGVLIVTRLKKQADDLAKNINELSGMYVAVARHTDTRLQPGEAAAAQVLVVTHAAYEGALDRVREVGDHHWSSFTQWNHGPRKLIVIDEAIDLVKPSQVLLKDVDFVLGVVPRDVSAQFPEQWTLIQEVQKLLVNISADAEEQSRSDRSSEERVLWTADMMQMPPNFSMSGFRTACRKVEWDWVIGHKRSASDRGKLGNRIDDTLEAIEATTRNWRWYSRKGNLHTLNTASLIVPDDIEGAVVLDATAGDDLVYDLFEKKADRIIPPAGARSYANVRLHVSRSFRGVGKVSMIDNAHERVPELLADLKGDLGSDCGRRNVLVVCHQKVEPNLAGISHPFASMDVAHWGAIDGRNDWSEFDTVVLFGLPYRDPIWNANTFMAFQGFQSNEWLNDPKQRGFKDFEDIRQSLGVQQLIVSTVQAINRVRCRRVIDSDGNGAPTDAYVYLSPDKTGNAVLNGIERNMPDIRVCEWKQAVEKPKPVRRSKWEETLISYVKGMPYGEVSATELRKELRIPKTTWDQLVKQMKEETSILFGRLAEIGASYVVRGAGKKLSAYLIKDG